MKPKSCKRRANIRSKSSHRSPRQPRSDQVIVVSNTRVEQ
jgi:hypothetical protein